MKALFYGVGIATVAGLMCGGAMKYGGRLSENPEGPQMLVSGPGARDVNPAGWPEGTALAGYRGEIPEYVVGTDWLQPVSFVAAYEEVAYLPAASPPAAEAIREATHDSPVTNAPPPQQTAAVYPSVDGDILAGMTQAAPAASADLARQSNDSLESLDEMNARIADDDYAAAERIARRPS